MSADAPIADDLVLPGLPRGQVGIAVSCGVAGKSFLLLETALAVATGRDIGGLWQAPIRAGAAYYICGTDPREIVRTRIQNVVAKGGDNEDGVPRHFHVFLDDSHKIALFARQGRRIEADPILGVIESLMTPEDPRLVVFEHFERYLIRAGLDWADPETRADVLRILRSSARRMNCAILVARHPWAEYPADHRPASEADWDLWLTQDSPDAPLRLSYADRRSNAPIERVLARRIDGVLGTGESE